MSIKVMMHVWDKSPVSGSELLLMLALADSSNDDGVCWPSVTKLALKTRINERHVRRLLADLTKDGLIEKNPRFRDGAQSSNSYRVIVGGDDSQTLPPGHSRVIPPLTQLSHTPLTQLSHTPPDIAESYRTVIEPSKNRDGEPGAPRKSLPPSPFDVLKSKGQKP